MFFKVFNQTLPCRANKSINLGFYDYLVIETDILADPCAVDKALQRILQIAN